MNKELLLKSFLHGDGGKIGERDWRYFKQFDGVEIKSDEYPSIFRWYALMKKTQGKRGHRDGCC